MLQAKDPLTKVSLEIKGNCGMCKKTIESAAKTDGVHKASWDKKTHILELQFNPKIISQDQIELRIAASGYDTPNYRANDSAYNSLHNCCKYPRDKKN